MRAFGANGVHLRALVAPFGATLLLGCVYYACMPRFFNGLAATLTHVLPLYYVAIRRVLRRANPPVRPGEEVETAQFPSISCSQSHGRGEVSRPGEAAEVIVPPVLREFSTACQTVERARGGHPSRFPDTVSRRRRPENAAHSTTRGLRFQSVGRLCSSRWSS